MSLCARLLACSFGSAFVNLVDCVSVCVCVFGATLWLCGMLLHCDVAGLCVRLLVWLCV